MSHKNIMPNHESERFEPEVLQEMTIKPLDVGDILGKIPKLTEEDLEGLDKRDRKMVFHSAKLEEQNILIVEALVQIKNEMRDMQANQIRVVIAFRKVVKWFIGVTVLGIMAQSGKWIWQRLFP